ncbi:MAG: hypothetical protein KDC84_16115 [Crocinitomicaceae bacterium]|nr:hypothetical protein [Crocinitomicaceae bacterium]
MKRESKTEYWKKWKFFELIDFLHSCDELIEKDFGSSEYDNSIMGELHGELLNIIEEIEFGNRADLLRIFEFIESKNILWNHLVENNKDLITNINEIVYHWKKHNG